MRKYNIYFKTAFAAFAIALSACSSDNDIVENNPANPETLVSNGTMTFVASVDADNTTRTTFSSKSDFKNNTVWAAGDKIKIVNVAGKSTAVNGLLNYGTFDISHADASIPFGKEELFSGTAIQSQGVSKDKFFALYPYNTKATVMSDSTLRIKGTLPIQQVAKRDSFAQSLHFMTAFSNNSAFAFKNVCALLKIKLVNSNIRRIKVVANPTLSSTQAAFSYSNYIAGGFSAIVSKTDGTTSNIDKNPDDADGTTRKTYVELRAEDNGDIDDGIYYMVVLPASLPNGFTLLLETSDDVNKTIYQRVASLNEFKRNKLYDLGTFDCDGTPEGMTALTNVVDLDLPSGTIWATKNIAAGNDLFVTNVYDYGQYYCWGEDFGFDENPTTGTNTKSDYTNPAGITSYDTKVRYEWQTYKWGPGSSTVRENWVQGYTELGKYNPSTDGKTILDKWVSESNKGDDIAQIKSQGKYCMPIYAQLYELRNYCTFESLSTYSGTSNKGYKVKSNADSNKQLWLPAGGAYYGSLVDGGWTGLGGKNAHRNYYESRGFYWSRTVVTNDGYNYHYAYSLDLNESGVNSDRRYAGRTIRAVATNASIAPLEDK